jgi:hypothetical protein
MPGMPTRPDLHRPQRYTRETGRVVRDPSRVVHWIGYHLGELVGTAGPAVLAVTVSWWFALATLLVAAGWIGHELRLRRHRRALTAAYRPAITGQARDITSAPEARPAPGIDHDSLTTNDTEDIGDTERRAER